MARAGIFVTGTDTGAGKTLVSCAILSALRRRGHRVAAFKPVETGCRAVDGAENFATERGSVASPGRALVGEDCQRLSAASGGRQAPGDIAACLFAEPAAPLVAAEAEGRRIDPARLRARFDEIASGADFVLVESAGGLMVPVADGYTTRDLARELALPTVVVVASRLGCINHALLTLEVLRSSGIPVAGFVMNECERDRAHALALATNREQIGRFTDAADLGVMPLVEASRTEDLDHLADLAEASLELDAVAPAR